MLHQNACLLVAAAAACCRHCCCCCCCALGVPCCLPLLCHASLVFVQPRKSLKVDIDADSAVYLPGGDVTLSITSRDADTNRPVPAIVGVTVTDETVIQESARPAFLNAHTHT